MKKGGKRNSQATQADSAGVQANLTIPSRLKSTKCERESEEIIDTFRKVGVNIPLLDIIKQIPRYAKFLKEMCSLNKNRKLMKQLKLVKIFVQFYKTLAPKVIGSENFLNSL